MTIVAGFTCPGGVVVCADSQETIGAAKRNIPKLRFEEVSDELAAFRKSMPICVAFCASTDSGPFADKLTELAWSAAKGRQSLDDACIAIEESIEKTYRHFAGIYQPGYAPSAELIYGVKAEGQSRLFCASGPVINEKVGYCTAGIGGYLADFLAERMHPHVLTINQCVILAAYVLHQTKEHVEGCGGESRIAILRDDDTSGEISFSVTRAITKHVAAADLEIGKFLLSFADLDKKDENVKTEVEYILSYLNLLRDEHKADIKNWEQFKDMPFLDLESDSYGIAKPSSSQKSLGQP